MIDTKLGKAHKDYRDTNKGIVEWIIGLTIAELGLIISQKLYSLNWLFNFFIILSSTSLILAIIIMLVIVSCVDSELYSGILVTNAEGKISEEEFEQKSMKRLGGFIRLLIYIVFEKKGYMSLFLSFALSTIAMITLIFCNIKNPLTP